MSTKRLSIIAVSVLVFLLAACSSPQRSTSSLPNSNQLIGLLKVTISGIGEGGVADARAEWVNPNAQLGVGKQSITLQSTYPTLRKRTVQFFDYDVNSTGAASFNRYVISSFDIDNTTATAFDNMTFYAVNAPGNIGSTGIFSMQNANGASITTASTAQSFIPVNPVRASYKNKPAVIEELSGLQYLTTAEVTSVKSQFAGVGIPINAEPLQYAFIARNYSGNYYDRQIGATGCGTDCNKGTLTLAYRFPRPVAVADRPYSFTMYFAVGNETSFIRSQSLDEQQDNLVEGLPYYYTNDTNPVRTVAGTMYSNPNLVPLCRIVTAGSIGTPLIYLGPDPIPTAAASLDVCFGSSGWRGVESGNYKAVKVQPDNKIVALAGNSNYARVHRYNTDGTLDTNFATDGTTDFNAGLGYGDYTDMALQSDGKIVAVGVESSNLVVVRFNSDGTLDTTGFGAPNGYVSFGSSIANPRVAVASDGKIVVAGTLSQDFYISRLNSDGTTDDPFGPNGDGTIQLDLAFGANTSDDHVTGLAIDSTNRVVVGGYSWSTLYGNDNEFAVLRLTTAGVRDSSFGPNTSPASTGVRLTDFGANTDDATSDLAIDASNNVVLVGHTDATGPSYNLALARYNGSNGTLDAGFGTGGLVNTDFNSELQRAYGVAIQANGKLVVLADTNNSDKFLLARYNTNGTLDTTFDTDGLATYKLGTSASYPARVAVSPNGKIVGVGSTSSFGPTVFVVNP